MMSWSDLHGDYHVVLLQLREMRNQNKYSISANYLEIYNEGTIRTCQDTVSELPHNDGILLASGSSIMAQLARRLTPKY
jgi:hypothetical protein